MESIDARFVGKISAVVREAAQVVQSQSFLRVSSKVGVGNIVTNADLESEKFIKDELAKLFPECVFWGEESITEITHRDFAEQALIFIVDPIDGTTNYSRHIPFCAISVGAWSFGRPIASVIYDLTTNDIYTAIIDGSVRKNGELILNDENGATNLKDCIIGSDWAYADTPRENLIVWERLVGNVMTLRVLGCAVLGLLFVATGQYTCYIHNSLKPYDVGAVILMLRNLGFKITNWEGEPFSIFDEKIIVAPPSLYDSLRQLVSGDTR